MSQARTVTVPEHEQPGFPEAAPVIGLRVLGGNCEFIFPMKPRLTVGADADCDIQLPFPYVSKVHCVIERDGDRLRLHDQSKNGTFIGGERRREGELADGTILILGTTPLVAFSQRHCAFRAALQRHLGWAEEHQQGVDHALAIGVTYRPALIVASDGLEPASLARVIHQHSPASSRPFVVAPAGKDWHTKRAQRDEIERAAHGVLYLPVESLPDDPGFVLAALGSASYRVRVIAAAPDRELAVALLGLDLYTRMQVIDVPTLLARRAELSRLIERVTEEEAVHWGGLPALTEADHARLADYHWPGNVVELRRILGHLAALAHHGSLRQAARALGITRQTLENRLDRIGLDRTAPRAWLPAPGPGGQG